MCFQRYKAYPNRAEIEKSDKIRLNPSDPICVRPHLPSSGSFEVQNWELHCLNAFTFAFLFRAEWNFNYNYPYLVEIPEQRRTANYITFCLFYANLNSNHAWQHGAIGANMITLHTVIYSIPAAFTGVLRGPGRKVPHGVLVECFLSTWLGVPHGVLFECFLSAFWHFWGLKTPKGTQKALHGALSGPGP